MTIFCPLHIFTFFGNVHKKIMSKKLQISAKKFQKDIYISHKYSNGNML